MNNLTKDSKSKISFNCFKCENKYRLEQTLHAHLLFHHGILKSPCSTNINLDRFNKMKNNLETIRSIKRELQKHNYNYIKMLKLEALALKLSNEIKTLGYDKVKIPNIDYSDLKISNKSHEYKLIQQVLDGEIEVII